MMTIFTAFREERSPLARDESDDDDDDDDDSPLDDRIEGVL